MGNIYCLMGKSASGKDTIYNRLLAMERLHLRRVVPYTTRPMRSGGDRRTDVCFLYGAAGGRF